MGCRYLCHISPLLYSQTDNFRWICHTSCWYSVHCMDTSNSLHRTKYILRKKLYIFSHYMYNRLILFPTVLAYFLLLFPWLMLLNCLPLCFYILRFCFSIHMLQEFQKWNYYIWGFFNCYNVCTLIKTTPRGVEYNIHFLILFLKFWRKFLLVIWLLIFFQTPNSY